MSKVRLRIISDNVFRLAVDTRGYHWHLIEELDGEFDSYGAEILANAWRCEETGDIITEEEVELV